MVRSGPAPEASAPEASAQAISATAALLGSPILSSQGMTGQITSRALTLEPAAKEGRLPKISTPAEISTPEGGTKPRWPRWPRWLRWLPKLWTLWSERRSLPSYISGKSFTEAVIDLVVPDAAGQTEMDVIQTNVKAFAEAFPEAPFSQSLQTLSKNAGGDISQFRTGVERWYDDHMDRVSGWYKRRVAKITLVVGALLVVLLNINALTIGRTLYTENTVSTAVSTVAAKGASCDGKTPQDCLAQLQGQLSAATTAGLPIGWGTVRDCTEIGAQCNWLDQRGIFSQHGDSGWQLVLVLIGFLIMVIALVPGAQFWFGLLSKLGTLRDSGPKPATSGS